MLSASEKLHQFKIFAELDPADLEAVAAIASTRTLQTGEELIAEGAPADSLYLFVKGKAAVKVRSAEGEQVLIDEVGPGELLGWSAVIEPQAYAASASTTEPSEVIVVPGKELRELCDTNKRIGYQVAKGVGEVVSRRFGKTVSGRGVPAGARRDLDELGRFAMFAQLSPSDLEAVAGISQAVLFDTGQQIITEGAEADTLYLFVKGNAAVKVSSAEGQQVLIDQVGPGELVGWSAVIEPHIYVASAWTTEPSEVISIPGEDLRALAKANSRIGYQVVKGIGEVMSKRFEKAIGRYDVDELRRFKMFADLDRADLDSIAKITSIEHYETGRELTAEGAPAKRMYLFVKGRAAVKVRSPEDSQVLIDEIRPGDLLGWSAAMDPCIYTASSWTTEPSEVIVVPGEDLRRLCESNKRIGYDVGKGIGEVISRRFGQAIGRHGDLLEKDLRAFQGEELVVWDNGELQLTTEAVLIGMGSEDPEVIPLEAVLDVEVQDGCVIFHAHGGDARSPRLDAPERFAALVRDEMLRTRHAHRRRS